MRKMILLLLALLLLPAAALGEIRTERPIFPNSPGDTTGHTFSGELPACLAAPFADAGLSGLRIISGAALENSGLFIMADEPGSYPACSALVVVEAADGLHLICAAWVEGRPWQVIDLGDRFLREGEPRVGYAPQPRMAVPVLTVTCGEVTDLYRFSGNRLWEMVGHVNDSAGWRIDSDAGSLCLTRGDERQYFSCRQGFWLEYMTGVHEFPTTPEACVQADAAARQACVPDPRAYYTSGANLRERATQSSPSLGLYRSGVPVEFLGDTQPGREYPWMHVRIGQTEGWMSSGYMFPGPHVPQFPLMQGRTLRDCTLLAQPGGDALRTLSPGIDLHILAEAEGGWYHVCIPQGEISWEPDPEGAFGYLRKTDLAQAWSPAGLDALTAP